MRSFIAARCTRTSSNGWASNSTCGRRSRAASSRCSISRSSNLQPERVIAAEALLRWNHPLLGEVAPDRFIGIAEEIGSIVEITAWVLEQACAHAAAMRALGLPAFRVASTFRCAIFATPGIHERIERALSENKLPPDALDLEITEGITLNDVAVKGARADSDRPAFASSSTISASDTARWTTSSGCRSARSRSTSRSSPTSSHNKHDQAIVKAITTLAESLGLGVVAEGVETTAQRDFLLTVHAPTAQGFYFSRPISRAAVRAARSLASGIFRRRIDAARRPALSLILLVRRLHDGVILHRDCADAC